MGLQVSDGRTGITWKINDEGQGVVRSITESEIEHASIQGNAYCWFAPTANIDVDDTLLFIKNLGDTPLILDRMNLLGANVAGTVTIHLGNDTTTPTAINVTGTNLNPGFGNNADVHATADEDLVADGTTVEIIHVPVTVMLLWPLTGIILPKGSYIQINQDTESTAGGVAVYGHFENPS